MSKSLAGIVIGLRTGLGKVRGVLTRMYSIEDPLLEAEFDDLEFDDSDEPSLLIEEVED